MQPYELIADQHQNDVRAFHGMQAGIWTALPGIIQSFNPTAKTAVIQPAIKAIVFAQDGTSTDVALPLLVDCPVFFPSGGGCTLTFPIAVGDECLVVFSSRCIDAWWFSGGIQVQAEMRMHDLSDGFAFVGVSSLPNVPGSINTSTVQLRSNDGAAYVSVNPTTHEVDITTSGNVLITAPTTTITGALVVTGSITNNGKNIGATHTHGGVQTGGGNTGAPN